MLNKKLVLVLGAGASHEVGLPVGDRLKEHVGSALDFRLQHESRLISGDSNLWEAIVQSNQVGGPDKAELYKFQVAAWRIRDAMPMAISIDNFIDAHQGDKRLELCAKLAIAGAILKAEGRSDLCEERMQDGSQSINFSKLNNSWFLRFFQLLSEDCPLDKLRNRLAEIGIICFNYDRCIEHFLYHSFQVYYGISAPDAAQMVELIEIFHPYGMVGHLPWSKGKGELAVKYGEDLQPSQLLDLAKSIKTFTEGIDPNTSDIGRIRLGMATARRVAFLGFAYHRLNLKLLRPDSSNLVFGRDVHYYGTAHGISDSNALSMKNEVRDLGQVMEGNMAIRNDLKCANLFDEYSRSLSLVD